MNQFGIWSKPHQLFVGPTFSSYRVADEERFLILSRNNSLVLVYLRIHAASPFDALHRPTEFFDTIENFCGHIRGTSKDLYDPRFFRFFLDDIKESLEKMEISEKIDFLKNIKNLPLIVRNVSP